jgi:hypothetical protein
MGGADSKENIAATMTEDLDATAVEKKRRRKHKVLSLKTEAKQNHNHLTTASQSWRDENQGRQPKRFKPQRLSPTKHAIFLALS